MTIGTTLEAQYLTRKTTRGSIVSSDTTSVACILLWSSREFRFTGAGVLRLGSIDCVDHVFSIVLYSIVAGVVFLRQNHVANPGEPLTPHGFAREGFAIRTSHVHEMQTGAPKSVARVG